MALVYATDVKHDGEFVRKRGDKFVSKDAKEFFGLEGDDAQELVDEGIVVQDSALPENQDPSGRSTSYYEMQAEMLRKYDENDITPESSLAGDIAKEPMKAQGVQSKAKADKDS